MQEKGAQAWHSNTQAEEEIVVQLTLDLVSLTLDSRADRGEPVRLEYGSIQPIMLELLRPYEEAKDEKQEQKKRAVAILLVDATSAQNSNLG